MTPLEIALCVIAGGCSLLIGVCLGRAMRWCGRYDDDQLPASWKPQDDRAWEHPMRPR